MSFKSVIVNFVIIKRGGHCNANTFKNRIHIQHSYLLLLSINDFRIWTVFCAAPFSKLSPTHQTWNVFGRVESLRILPTKISERSAASSGVGYSLFSGLSITTM